MLSETECRISADIGIIPTSCVIELSNSADKGDERAAAACSLIFGWAEWASTKERPPYCIACDTELAPDQLGGYAVLVPKDSQDQRGVAAGFCKNCQSIRSQDQLRQAFRHAVSADRLGSLDPTQ